MNASPPNPPYFDGLFERLSANDPLTSAAFGRHVHWGYWKDPFQVCSSAAEYGVAAEALTEVILNVADIQTGQRILDVGCGFGGTLASLNEQYSGLELAGVNIDPRQIGRARELVLPRNGNRVDFIQADAAHIPLEGSAFDRLLAVECIFHFDRAAFLAEAGRLLKTGGSLTLSDFVPSERAAEYLDGLSLSEGIQWAYGKIDLTGSLARYQALAEQSALRLEQSLDITGNTLPTYGFLYSSTADWPNQDDIRKFTDATRLLEKASRKGLIAYQVLKFTRV